jgi:hypothetical protein
LISDSISYAKEIRKSAAWSGGIELVVNLHIVQSDVPVFEPTDDPGAFRCIRHFECPVVVKTKKLVYRGRSHKNVLKPKQSPTCTP